jgi:hypothetical protein
MIEELPNPYDEETFRQWVTQEAGKTWWFEYRVGGMVFIYDADYISGGMCVGVIEKDVIFDVLGYERYHQIKGSPVACVGVKL